MLRRRVTAAALAVALLAVPAASGRDAPPASSVSGSAGPAARAPGKSGGTSLRILRPRAKQPVASHRVLLDAVTTLDVRGRAHPRSFVTVEAVCVRRPCVATVAADERGRWRAPLRIVVPNKNRSIVVTARSGSHSTGVAVALEVPAPPTNPPADAPYFAMIGDSLAEGTANAFPGLLPTWRVSSDFRRGRPVGEGMTAFDTHRLPSRARVVAFSLFTNDDPRNVGLLERSVRESVERVGPRGCAVWATIARPRVRGVSYDEPNALLNRLDIELGDRLEVVRWAEAVARNEGWMSRDDVHPTGRGYAERAAMYATAARRCLEARLRTRARRSARRTDARGRAAPRGRRAGPAG